MSLQQRLANCKQYREEALKHPRANKLYIEDLDLSIAYLEEATKHNNVIVGNGWIDSEE